MRVEIPAYTDRWMMGDRYGEVIKTTRHMTANPPYPMVDVHHVKLDKSGKTVRVIADDCKEV